MSNEQFKDTEVLAPQDATPTRRSGPLELASFLSAALKAAIDFCRLKGPAPEEPQDTESEESDAPVAKPHPIDVGLLTKILPFPAQDG